MAYQVSKQNKIYLPILNHIFNNQVELDLKKRTNKFPEVVGATVCLKSLLSILLLTNLLNTPHDDISLRLDLPYSLFNILANKNMSIRHLYLYFHDFLLDTKRQENIPF